MTDQKGHADPLKPYRYASTKNGIKFDPKGDLLTVQDVVRVLEYLDDIDSKLTYSFAVRDILEHLGKEPEKCHKQTPAT